MPEIRLAAALEGEASSERAGGRPVPVLGNSLGTSREVWAPQVPALARRFRLLRLEPPGHGAEHHQPPAGSYRLDDLGKAVLALLDEHGIDRAYYCGISAGGMIGMWLAGQDPATPPAHGALIARRVRGSRLVVIRGASHLASLQAPGPATAALLGHLACWQRLQAGRRAAPG